MVQRKRYVPGVEKVRWNVPVDLSPDPVAASSKVTLCGAAAQDHVTVPPEAIVKLAGLKTVPPSPTVSVRASGAAVMVVANFTGDPDNTGVDVAVTVSGPTVSTTVCDTVAIPCALVLSTAGVISPPPAVAAQSTRMWATPLPCASRPF